MKNLTIVIIAFNRVNSLKRLLNSLENLSLKENEKITLYISIDKSKFEDQDNIDVFEYAKDYIWRFGDKIVNFKKENMGLKKHILECGNLTNTYENIIVLEDDIVVAPLMYEYAKQVIEFYEHDKNIAGFSLYSYPRNQMNNLLFTPLNNRNGCLFYANGLLLGTNLDKRKME